MNFSRRFLYGCSVTGAGSMRLKWAKINWSAQSFATFSVPPLICRVRYTERCASLRSLWCMVHIGKLRKYANNDRSNAWRERIYSVLLVWQKCRNDLTHSELSHESLSCIKICRFSPDGSHLLTGSDDESLALWDIRPLYSAKGGDQKRSSPRHKSVYWFWQCRYLFFCQPFYRLNC